MKIEVASGIPAEDGIYACRQWYAWRILEWKRGAWFHAETDCPWPIAARSGETGIEGFVGPLPRISKDFTATPVTARGNPLPPPMEFDL